MRIFLIILQQELILSFRSLGKILASFLFFLISLTVFFMMLQDHDNQALATSYAAVVIWFSLISCVIFSAAEFLKRDFEDGTIEQILASGENFEVFTLAKMLANWLIYALPILGAMPIVVLFASLEQIVLINFMILAFFASLIINFICTFCGSLSLVGNSAPMIAIIALPLIIPTLLIAHGGLVLENFALSLKLLCGLTIFFGSVATVATAKIVKIVAE